MNCETVFPLFRKALSNDAHYMVLSLSCMIIIYKSRKEKSVSETNNTMRITNVVEDTETITDCDEIEFGKAYDRLVGGINTMLRIPSISYSINKLSA